MATHRKFRSRLGRLLLAGAACCALGGCKLFERSKDDRVGSADERADPLLGGTRIPATNLPTREGAGRASRDPLMGSPTGRDDRTSHAREPFRNGPDTTTAGLTGRLNAGQSAPGIGERRDDVPAATPASPRYDDVLASLRKFKATWGEPTKSGDDYSFKCDVPIEGGADGAKRRYEGVGRTETAAALDALDQVKNDRGLD